jgi:hypothetical protein
MAWPGQKPRNDFCAFYKAFQLMTALIVAAATKTVREVIRIQILNSGCC